MRYALRGMDQGARANADVCGDKKRAVDRLDGFASVAGRDIHDNEDARDSRGEDCEDEVQDEAEDADVSDVDSLTARSKSSLLATFLFALD